VRSCRACILGHFNPLPILILRCRTIFGLETYIDRLLATQANVEAAEFVTADPIFAHYPVQVLW